ncbi:hypothetical protein BaRGS_00039192, partial [Batillaria attramentaria]
AIADCAWLKKDTLMCGKMADGYEFNHMVNSQLTVTIKEASSAFVGTYECIPQPSYPGDTESCFFSLKVIVVAAVGGSVPGIACIAGALGVLAWYLLKR